MLFAQLSLLLPFTTKVTTVLKIWLAQLRLQLVLFDNLTVAQGTVVFGSSNQGWGFTISSFFKEHARKFGLSAEFLAPRLWGDSFYDTEAKKWLNCAISNKVVRGFCKFILHPLLEIWNAIAAGDTKKHEKHLEQLNITLSGEEKVVCKFPRMSDNSSDVKRFSALEKSDAEVCTASFVTSRNGSSSSTFSIGLTDIPYGTLFPRATS